MIQIIDRSAEDAINKLYVADCYMAWALLAAEEVLGKPDLDGLLKEAGLVYYIDNYPPPNLAITGQTTFGDYARLNTILVQTFPEGQTVRRIGQIQGRYVIKQQDSAFDRAIIALAKALPVSVRIRMAAESLRRNINRVDLDAGQTVRIAVEDRGKHVAYIQHDCPLCAGKVSSHPMCALQAGAFEEGTRWLVGTPAQVEEVSCRAIGDPACVWEISKSV